MRITEIKCKIILTPTKVASFRWSLNPYVGCQHDCLYCYASFMSKWHGAGAEWGDFVEVKVNASEVLEQQLKKKKRGEIWIASICDPYQPIEAKYKLTRRCLEKLKNYPDLISILTKSDLVLRDLDLIKSQPQTEVGFTITTLDEKVAKIFEPRAPAPHRRLEALKKLNKAGIETYVMLAPLIPYFSDSTEALNEIFSALVQTGVKKVMVDAMNYLKKQAGQRIKPVLEQFGDEVKDAFDFATSPYYSSELRRRAKSAVKDYEQDIKLIF